MKGFEDALAVTLGFEGGYSNDPRDAGGATNRGITQATYDAWKLAQGYSTSSVRNIRREEIEAIYRERYWKPSHADRMMWPLSLAVFDSAVLCGVGTAYGFYQAVSHQKSITDQALNVIEKRKAYHWKRCLLSPARLVFLKGWLNRCKKLAAVVKGG